ncbi:hypothetical protein RhiTH_006883 [Rhizoctonia solani]
MVYNAVFMTYLLLSNFELIGEKERWAVELVVDLSVSYDLDLGRIDMSRDVFGKVRILLPQLCLLAARYGYEHTGTEVEFNERTTPKPYEHREIKTTLSDAHDLLDIPLPQLCALVHQWYSNNFELVLQTAPLPRSNQPPASEENKTKTKIVRIRGRDPKAKRYGWTPTRTCEDPSFGSEKCKVSSMPSLKPRERPRLFQLSTNMHISREELARREWPLSPVTICSVSSDSHDGPTTPCSQWDDSFGSNADSRDVPRSLFGQTLKKGFKAMFF